MCCLVYWNPLQVYLSYTYFVSIELVCLLSALYVVFPFKTLMLFAFATTKPMGAFAPHENAKTGAIQLLGKWLFSLAL